MNENGFSELSWGVGATLVVAQIRAEGHAPTPQFIKKPENVTYAQTRPELAEGLRRRRRFFFSFWLRSLGFICRG